MTNKPKKDILKKIGIQKPETMVSILNFSLGKDGFFRANLNGVRVNKSCRTVITPNPYLDCNQCVCPQKIAEIIGVPIRVNSQNIDYVYSLIQNYPNYPCALQVNTNNKINENNKDKILIIPGDIVYRQVIDNDICLANRYPSVREESFGGSKVKVIQGQSSIQFNLSVVEKFNADFDGDEMQLFFMPSTEDNLEITLLSSPYQQFIEYTSNKNIIGGAKDLKAGLYHIKHFNKDDSYITIDPKETLNHITNFIQNYYIEDSMDIKDYELQQYDSSIADSQSDFLTYISFYYGQSKALDIIDNTIKLCYLINEANNYSLYNTIFNTNTDTNNKYSKEQSKYEQDRIKETSNLLETYFNGTFQTPLGVDKTKFFDVSLQSQLSINEIIQNQLILDQYTGKDYIDLYNKDISKNIVAYHKALIAIGFCDNGQGQSLIQLPRLLPCYPKFSTDITHYGYTQDRYIDGINQTSQFLISFEGRRQAYIRGNVIRDSGYMQRRVQKAFDNVYLGYNNIIYGNNNTIISLQFGQYSFDPRLYITKQVKYNDNWNSQQKEIYNYLITLQNECQKQGFTFEENTLQFVLPFDIDQLYVNQKQTITQKELNMILSHRITSNMSNEFKEIVYQQCFNIYSYLILTKDISDKQIDYSNMSLIQSFIKSISSPGDAIGIKAAMAITGPLSQDTLDAIHHTKSSSGRIQYVQEDKLNGSQRFLELTQATNEYTQFTAHLLGKNIKQEKLATKFIQDYQTLYLYKLHPSINIFYENKTYIFQILFDFQYLSYNNVNLNKLIDDLIDFLENKQLEIKYTKQKEVSLEFKFSTNINQEQLLQYRIDLLTTFQFGSKILYNLYYIQKQDNFYIKGNIFNNQIQNIFYIQELDYEDIQISSIPFYNEYFGIFKTEHQLFNEYYNNIENISVTKGLNKAFYQLFSSFQTQSGKYTGFQRYDYKKDPNRDFIQNIIYEEGTAFIINAVKKQQNFTTQSFQNTQLFGTYGQAGTNISQYFQ